MIKYLGSKRELIAHILKALPKDVRTVADVFSGTGRVSYALREFGKVVHANDYMLYAYHLSRCYTQADTSKERQIQALLQAMRDSRPRAGYITTHYCEKARFFKPKNGERIDGMAEYIRANLAPDDVMSSVAWTALLLAADRVDSTVGLQMAYLKQWAARADKDLELRVPALCQASAPVGTSSCADAQDFAAQLSSVDLAYLDPPYNQHSYLGNYHIWETLCRGDEPATYGVAQKREDVCTRKSPYNSKKTCAAALKHLLDTLPATYALLSYSNEGFLSPSVLRELLVSRSEHVTVFEFEHGRYIGSQIGIYNPSGQKVGSAGATRNKEFMYLVQLKKEDARS